MKRHLSRALVSIMLAGCGLAAGSAFAQAFNDYVVGKVTNFTTTSQGVLINVSNLVPTICSGTPYNWLIIETAAMQSLVMGLYLQGNLTSVTLTAYAGGIDSTGYCYVTQVAPPLVP